MKLWLIRHAKSSWGQSGLSDFDRPLNARGKRDGPKMAEWLSSQAAPATWVWTSSAVRAQATARFVQEGFSLDGAALIALDELYHATPEQILDVVRRTPSEIQSVAVVAHNPGLTWLVNAMGADALIDNLPTFGVALFDCPEPWHDLRPGHSTLERLVSPKNLGEA